jgi:hypothetical protein
MTVAMLGVFALCGCEKDDNQPAGTGHFRCYEQVYPLNYATFSSHPGRSAAIDGTILYVHELIFKSKDGKRVVTLSYHSKEMKEIESGEYYQWGISLHAIGDALTADITLSPFDPDYQDYTFRITHDKSTNILKVDGDLRCDSFEWTGPVRTIEWTSPHSPIPRPPGT